VSKVVLKRFTSPRSSDPRRRDRLAVFDRRSGRVNDRSLGGAFIHPNFVAHDQERVERRWSAIESRAIRIYRELDQSVDGIVAPDIEQDLRALVALHWARSEGLREVHDRVSTEALAASKARTAHLPGWADAFRRRTGLELAGPEALRIIQEEIYAELAEPKVAEFFSERILAYYESCAAFLERYRVQIGRTRARALIIGDVPVITPNRASGGLAVHQGVGLYDAQDLFMPIGPDLLVSFGKEPGEKQLTNEEVDVLNGWQASAFVRWLGSAADPTSRAALARFVSCDIRHRPG
jgi:hypothetical protein